MDMMMDTINIYIYINLSIISIWSPYDLHISNISNINMANYTPCFIIFRCTIVLPALDLQDPLLQMLDLQDVDGTLRGAPRAELRRMALMVGEKMLKAACSLLQRAADRRSLKRKSFEDFEDKGCGRIDDCWCSMDFAIEKLGSSPAKSFK